MNTMNDGLARLQHWCSTSFHIGCNHRRWSTFFCSLGSFAFFPFQVLVDKEISRTIDDINQISTSFDCFSNVTFLQNCIEPFFWCPKYDLKIGFDSENVYFVVLFVCYLHHTEVAATIESDLRQKSNWLTMPNEPSKLTSSRLHWQTSGNLLMIAKFLASCTKHNSVQELKCKELQHVLEIAKFLWLQSKHDFLGTTCDKETSGPKTLPLLRLLSIWLGTCQYSWNQLHFNLQFIFAPHVIFPS